MKQLWIVFFLFAIITGCDPLRRIDIKNKSGNDAVVIWTICDDMDSLYNSPFFISGSREVKFKLKSQKPFNDVNMSFGIGTWKKKDLDFVVKDLKSLEIKWKDKDVKLKKPEDISNYLYIRRRGIGNSKIKIVLE